jgi:cytochrome P450
LVNELFFDYQLWTSLFLKTEKKQPFGPVQGKKYSEMERKQCTARTKAVGAGLGMEDLEKLPYIRAVLAESLRMFPQPPILIRRALADDTLPSCLNGDPDGYPVGKGADIFISVWNLHR